MSNLGDILNTISVALQDPTGFDLEALNKEVVELHAKLTETKVAWAANEYLRKDKEAGEL